MLWRIPVAAVLSAVLMMMWGFLFWVALAFPADSMPAASDEAALSEALTANLPESGVYFLPNPFQHDASNAEEKAAFAQRHAAGPVAHIFYQKNGFTWEDPSMYGKGLAHYFCLALLTAVLVGYTARKRTFFGRLFIALLVVVIAVGWTLPANMIWYYHPVEYTALFMGYNLVGGLLMSLVIALLVRRKKVED